METNPYRDIDATVLASRLGTDDEPFVLDVREPDEVAQWAIPGSVNIPLGSLEDSITALPRNEEIVTVCAAGGRSAQAAEVLATRDFRVANLVGGMGAWGGVYDSVAVEDGALTVVQVRRRGKGCLSYVVGAGNQAFVFDPSRELEVYREVAREHEWSIVRVFDTHLHADHLSGAQELAAVSGATLHLNPADAFDFPFVPLRDGEQFELAPDIPVSVAAFSTPGHTQGSTVYFVGEHIVLSGDTLFVDGVGRPDLAERAEEFAHSLYRSLHERVLALSDETLILPAHYGDDVPVQPDQPVGARLGALRSQSALALDEDAFVAWAVARVTPRPPNYVDIVNANMGRTKVSESDRASLELGPNRCAL